MPLRTWLGLSRRDKKSSISKPCTLCGPDLYERTHTKGDIPVTHFQENSKAGCQECTLVLAAVEAYEPGWVEKHLSTGKINRSSQVNQGELSIQLRDNAESHMFKILHHQAENEPYNGYPISSSRDIIKETNSSAGLARVSAWLNECVQTHQKCEATENNFMPRRLLEFPLQEEKEGSFPFQNISSRLVETVELPQGTSYAALSYCWGTDLDGLTTTTKENLDAHRRRIDFEELPKTIKDAVLVCKALQIHYLWVDSLCIVQNDKEEWQKEASEMQRVYRHSLITLAIHEAKSCKEGFLGEQEFGQEEWQSSFHTMYKLPNTTKATMNKFQMRKGRDPRTHLYHAYRSPLVERCWTFQESIFPRRILHYMGLEMAWECDETQFCECGHLDGELEIFERYMVKSGLRRTSSDVDGWMALIQMYTARHLTYDSDKLVAISGLAQNVDLVFSAATAPSLTQSSRDEEQIQGVPHSTTGKYLAGIFMGALPRQLLWQIDADYDEEISQTRTQPYRAPTWSWASSDAHITYQRDIILLDNLHQPHVIIHEEGTYCTPATASDPQGAVTDGQLRLEGKLIPAALITITSPRRRLGNVYEGENRSAYVRIKNGKICHVSLDIVKGVDVSHKDPAVDCWQSCWRGSPEDTEPDQTVQGCDGCRDLIAKASGFYCLAISTCHDTYTKKYTTYFLLLERSSRVPGAYERIGMGPAGAQRGFSSEKQAGSGLWDEAESQIITIV